MDPGICYRSFAILSLHINCLSLKHQPQTHQAGQPSKGLKNPNKTRTHGMGIMCACVPISYLSLKEFWGRLLMKERRENGKDRRVKLNIGIGNKPEMHILNNGWPPLITLTRNWVKQKKRIKLSVSFWRGTDFSIQLSAAKMARDSGVLCGRWRSNHQQAWEASRLRAHLQRAGVRWTAVNLSGCRCSRTVEHRSCELLVRIIEQKKHTWLIKM